MKIVNFECDVCKIVRETAEGMEDVTLEISNNILYRNLEYVCLTCRNSLSELLKDFLEKKSFQRKGD